jgi:hypothetical protein
MYHICRPVAYKHNLTGRNKTGLRPVNVLVKLPFHFFTFIFPEDSFHSPVVLRQNLCLVLLILEVSRSHIMTHNNW